MKTVLSPLLVWVLLCAGGLVHAGEPPTAPILRIEPGMHTAQVNHVAVDATGRLALTVSFDKTARLWELPSGRLLRVLRPPIGGGNEGKLIACALSPDGVVAAVGGWTGMQWDNSVSIYVFETATGRMAGCLGGLPNEPFNLAFSASGRFLAAVMPGNWGLRVWETAAGREIGRDASYGGGDGYGLDWHGDARLVTACTDGNLRLYEVGESGLKGIARQPAQGGRWPHAARFSPDGRRIAVGFGDSARLAVLDGADLHWLYAPVTTGVNNGTLENVAWTQDGETLGAAGKWQREVGKIAVRIWPGFAPAVPRDYNVASDTIMDLRALPDGSILFASCDAGWGVLGTNGVPAPLGASPLADYRDPHPVSQLRLSDDGMVVGFGYEPSGGHPARFSLSSRQLALGADAGASAGLRPPLVEGLKVSDWKDTFTPKFNGKRLPLIPSERSRSLAIGRDASGFLLGTNWYLRRFAPKGQERWKVEVPATVWAVNLAEAGQLAVAAYGDGTIRWHRSDTGEELLAFFPHADQKRWVLWTPQGYYDCSPGAEDLIGWHVNRGREHEAEFFPASKFRNIYYRPDVIARVLRTRDVAEALRQANHELGLPETRPEGISEVINRLAPPLVDLETGGVFGLVTLPAEATGVKLRYRVRQTGAEAPEKVSIRFNGRLLDVPAPLPARDGETAEVTVPLPAGMSGELSVIAGHRLAVSEAAVLRVAREPGGTPPRRPNLYLVAVGVSDVRMNDAADLNRDGHVTMEEIERSGLFKEGDVVLPDLEHAADDARHLAGAFQAQQGRLYDRVVTNLLLDKAATVPAVREALRTVARESAAEDVAVFFFSGHGVVDSKAGFYFATYEADPKAPATTALTGVELSTMLEGIKARTVLALDTCHSGGAFGGTRFTKIITGPKDLTGLVNQLTSAEQGTIVLSSSSASEESLEDPKKGGLLTEAVCDGLSNKPTVSPTLSCLDLQTWVLRRVPELVAALVNGAPDAPQQTPVCVMPKGVPDFPLAQP